MKKIFFMSLTSFLTILAYMLVVWFFVPVEYYTDIFATEQIMRLIAPLSPLYLLNYVFRTQLIVTFVFFSVSLYMIFIKEIKTKLVLIFSLALPSVTSFLLNVFLVKPRRLIGFGGDIYPAQTIMDSSALYFNVTLFDVLFAIEIGLITTLLVVATYKLYKSIKK